MRLPQPAAEVSRQAVREHGDGLYALTSFGVESALLPHALREAGVEAPFITIDTGFWFPETHDFKHELSDRYGLDVLVYGPSEEDAEAIAADRLWETDIDAYHEITKHEPLRRAIGELGVTGLLAGVRGGQTGNRSRLAMTEAGKDGETRIHPLLDISETFAARYFRHHGLPRHPLYYQGYGSVGDWTLTRPGTGREGRDLPAGECGLHVTESGLFVQAAS